MRKTRQFTQLPWIGTLNLSVDPSMIAPNQLIQADHVIFDTRGSRKKRPGITSNWDSGTSAANSIVGGFDFWFGSTTRAQLQIAISDSKTMYKYSSSGTRTALTLDSSATAWSSSITQADFTSLNNTCLIAVDGSGNVPRKYTGSGNVYDLGSLVSFPASVSRSSSGTTRTIVFASDVSLFLKPGYKIRTASSGNASYNGDFYVNTVDNVTITFTGSGVLAEASTGDVNITLKRIDLVPQASIFGQHLGRVWANDKTNPDRIHYSTTGEIEEWNGVGDSGALDIGVGDGDPTGFTAIFPTYKGVLFVAKRTKLYRIEGDAPENFQVTLVTSGLGCVGANAFAQVDQDDLVFISDRGIHSLATTQAYGDFLAGFLSKDIQKAFNDSFTKSRLKYAQAAYIPEINSIMFALTDETQGTGVNNAIWLYNMQEELKGWYRWPSISCQSLWKAEDSDKKRAYLGTNTNRVAKTLNGLNYDISTAGVSTAIAFTIKTGVIYVDQGISTAKGFKKFSLVYKPQGTHTITVDCKVDNYQTQSLQFTQTGSVALLGTTLTLGSGTLGYDVTDAPYTQSIDGWGRGIQVTIRNAGIDETVEIQGFLIEWSPGTTQQEVITS